MATRMLVAYSRYTTHVQTTLDYLLMLKKHSGFDVDFVHVTHDAVMDFDLDAYDVVFNNYCARHCFPGYVSQDFIAALNRFRGLKVMAVQDEYDNTDRLKSAIRDLGFGLVLTCVPQSSIERIYPQAEFPGVEFMTVFTGYVADSLVDRGTSPKPLASRPIPVGYRGRDIGGRYGRLGFDKYEIGRRMKIECDTRGIANDIAMDEASRIYGSAWFDFIENCRTMLGSESGSNVFDFDGSLARRYAELTATNRGRPPSYAEFAPIIGDRESAISMGQVSPRVFECAALRTPMILFRGSYSDVVEPGTHYIALEKDFSNVAKVLEQVNDLESLAAMAGRAYRDVIASGRFTYDAMLRDLRDRIERRLADRSETVASISLGVGEADSSPNPLANDVLAERPTPMPEAADAFLRKQRRVSAVLAKRALLSFHRPRQMGRLAVASIYVLRHNAYSLPIVKKAIKLIPPSLLYRIKRRLLN